MGMNYCDGSLLPEYRVTPLELALEKALAAKYCRFNPDIIRHVHDPQQCPAHLLPWLAFSLSVDVWDDNWPEATKRGAIVGSLDVHRTKGTLGAVEDALDALGIESSVTEWFNQSPPGQAATCRISTNFNDMGAAGVTPQQMAKQIRRTKRLSIHCSVWLLWELVSSSTDTDHWLGILRDSHYVQTPISSPVLDVALVTGVLRDSHTIPTFASGDSLANTLSFGVLPDTRRIQTPIINAETDRASVVYGILRRG